jgi:hypothetical protein
MIMDSERRFHRNVGRSHPQLLTYFTLSSQVACRIYNVMSNLSRGIVASFRDIESTRGAWSRAAKGKMFVPEAGQDVYYIRKVGFSLLPPLTLTRNNALCWPWRWVPFLFFHVHLANA